MTILALHGFLGTGKDFQPLIAGLTDRGVKAEWLCPSLFAKQSHYSLNSLPELARDLTKDLQQIPGKKVLLGYSMGGRLALEMFLAQPQLWERVILMSTHLGIDKAEDQRARLQSDEVWAKRFQEMPWDEVLGLWNAQEVFKKDVLGNSSVEADYDRNKLAHALLNLSVARQSGGAKSNLKPYWSKLRFLAGEGDQKFLNLHTDWKNKEFIPDFQTICGRGHRLLQEPTEQLLTKLVDDLKL